MPEAPFPVPAGRVAIVPGVGVPAGKGWLALRTGSGVMVFVALLLFCTPLATPPAFEPLYLLTCVVTQSAPDDKIGRSPQPSMVITARLTSGR